MVSLRSISIEKSALIIPRLLELSDSVPFIPLLCSPSSRYQTKQKNHPQGGFFIWLGCLDYDLGVLNLFNRCILYTVFNFLFNFWTVFLLGSVITVVEMSSVYYP